MATPKQKFNYVYVLLSDKDNKFYVGSTSDLRKRIIEHAKGRVDSTKNRRPLSLVFYEAYLNKYDSLRREDYFKSSKGKIYLRNMLKEFMVINKRNNSESILIPQIGRISEITGNGGYVLKATGAQPEHPNGIHLTPTRPL
ncbi:GIY-YIG nuclease family protein [bacterium]|nr:GIY-YIG nuclease family protein [bacterium]